MMLCPTCGKELAISSNGDPWSNRACCDGCGWHSERFDELVRKGKRNREARLRFEQADPGFYGPKGERLELLSPHPSGWGHRLQCSKFAIYAETVDELRKVADELGCIGVDR